MINKKYVNEDLINEADEIAADIIQSHKSKKFRDHFFPDMINRLDLKSGAEIGVDKAGFSNHILSKTQIEKYFCVDTWQDDFGSDCRPGYFAKEGNVRYNEAREIIKPYLGDFEKPWLDSGRAVMLRMTGNKAAETIPNNSLEFIYIDGDHSLQGIYDDIYNWMPKMKIGSIIAGHDYKDGPRSGINDFFGNQLDYKVKTVVDYYCQRYGHKLNTVGSRILSWWFVKNT